MAETVRKMNAGANPERISEHKAAFVVSTPDEDRDGDIVNPEGLLLDHYRRAGAPVLWAHDTKQPPVAKSPDIRVAKGVLRAVAEFPEKGIYPFADTIRGLVLGGFVRGASVGFHPISAEPRKGKGVHFHKAELLEWSILPIPSNRSALVDAASKGLDIAPVLKGAEWLLDTRRVDADTLDLVHKAVSYARPSVHLGRGSKTIGERVADSLRESALAAVREAVRTRLMTPEEALAQHNAVARDVLTGVMAQNEARTVVGRDEVTGETITLGDVQVMAERQAGTAIMAIRQQLSGRGSNDPSKVHRFGEVDPESVRGT